MMRERLDGTISLEVQDSLLKPSLEEDLEHYYDAMNQINAAHLVMLSEQRLIDNISAARLAEAIAHMPSKSEFIKYLSPELEEIYYNVEAYLSSRVGNEISGWLHLGRSRNDMYATASRIKVRTVYFDICRLVLKVMSAMLKLADIEAATVITGYTHMQPAEPITVGHYLAGVVEAAERDYARLEQSYERLNLSPMGACALAGTSHDIDRHLVASLLGFEGIVNNSLDSVASRDFIPEILADLAILMITVSRFAGDLYIWVTDEFSQAEITDSVAASSSIMPQKKNPITLEHAKSKAAHLSAAFIDSVMALKNTPFTHSRDVSSESVRPFWGAAQEAIAALHLTLVSVENLRINRERMLERARCNFTTATELANSLARIAGIPFREAHGLVARVTAATVKEKERSDAITWETLRDEMGAAYTDDFESALKDAVAVSLDPTRNVEAKSSLGSPNPSLVLDSIRRLYAKIRAHDELLSLREKGISEARLNLRKRLAALAGVSGDVGGQS